MRRSFVSSSSIRSQKKSCAKCSSRFQKTLNSSGVRKNQKTWALGLSSNRGCARFFAPKLLTQAAKPAPVPQSARWLDINASKRASWRTRLRFESAHSSDMSHVIYGTHVDETHLDRDARLA